MARFLDKRTGQIIEVFKRPQIVNRRQRRDRYEELHNTDDTDTAGLQVPDGTVTEILEWAGDDPARQTAAVEAERRGKQRKGILEAFT